jgi:hypothetical protein
MIGFGRGGILEARFKIKIQDSEQRFSVESYSSDIQDAEDRIQDAKYRFSASEPDNRGF